MKEMAPENFRLDFAVSREQTNAAGEKMYIQTRMAEYKEELWELLKKDNTYVYMCVPSLAARSTMMSSMPFSMPLSPHM